MFVPVDFEVRNRANLGLIFVSIFGSSESGEISVSAKRLKMVLVIMDLMKDTSVEVLEFLIPFLVATLTAAIQELNAKFDAYVASHP